MNTPHRLMAILAHPDDEALGIGSTLAKYAAEGVTTELVMATRGERGWAGDPQANPGLEALGAFRTKELLNATRILGVDRVEFLGYCDGELDQADPEEAIARIVTQIRRAKPQVVVSFGHDGVYGHPDHIAISQFATAAVFRAVDSSYTDLEHQPPHRVDKFYYFVDTKADIAVYLPYVGDMMMLVDGVERRASGWDEWAISARIAAPQYWRTAWEAVRCHGSQIANTAFETLSDAQHEELWGTRNYYRVFSLVNGGRAIENDLFEGIR